MRRFLLLYVALLPVVSHGLDLESRLMNHVAVLASDSLEGRGITTTGISKAEHYLVDQLMAMGLELQSRDSFTVSLQDGESSTLANVITTVGTSSRPALMIAAHFDHLGIERCDSTGQRAVYNGAHDNASGVSVVLETAGVLVREGDPSRDVCFVFFTAEESGLLGSRHFVERLGDSKDDIYACINLDAVGHLDTGAVMAVGLEGQPELDSLVTEAFTSVGISITRAAKSYATGDQVPFLEQGIPAVMLTTGPHPLMNTLGDDATTLDYDGMRRITTAIVDLVHALDGNRPLLSDPPKPESMQRSPRRRRVRFGIMPDFTFKERGVCAGGVVPSSPAERAGVRSGDVLVAMAGDSLLGPRSLAEILARHEPGDSVEITLLRDNELIRTLAVLEQREH
jgi:hypothetical protein